MRKENTINLKYQYDSNDIQAIGMERIKQLQSELEKQGCSQEKQPVIKLALDVSSIAATNQPGSLSHCLSDIIQERTVSAETPTRDRLLFIPRNPGGHWESLILKLDSQNKITQAHFIDSLKSSISHIKEAKASAVMPKDHAVVKALSAAGYKGEVVQHVHYVQMPTDTNVCGVLMIENAMAVMKWLVLGAAHRLSKVVCDAIETESLRKQHIHLLGNGSVAQKFAKKQMDNADAHSRADTPKRPATKIDGVGKAIKKALFSLQAARRKPLLQALKQRLPVDEKEHTTRFSHIRQAFVTIKKALEEHDSETDAQALDTLLQLFYKTSLSTMKKIGDKVFLKAPMEICVEYDQLRLIAESIRSQSSMLSDREHGQQTSSEESDDSLKLSESSESLKSAGFDWSDSYKNYIPIDFGPFPFVFVDIPGDYTCEMPFVSSEGIASLVALFTKSGRDKWQVSGQGLSRYQAWDVLYSQWTQPLFHYVHQEKARWQDEWFSTESSLDRLERAVNRLHILPMVVVSRWFGVFLQLHQASEKKDVTLFMAHQQTLFERLLAYSGSDSLGKVLRAGPFLFSLPWGKRTNAEIAKDSCTESSIVKAQASPEAFSMLTQHRYLPVVGEELLGQLRACYVTFESWMKRNTLADSENQKKAQQFLQALDALIQSIETHEAVGLLDFVDWVLPKVSEFCEDCYDEKIWGDGKTATAIQDHCRETLSPAELDLKEASVSLKRAENRMQGLLSESIIAALGSAGGLQEKPDEMDHLVEAVWSLLFGMAGVGAVLYAGHLLDSVTFHILKAAGGLAEIGEGSVGLFGITEVSKVFRHWYEEKTGDLSQETEFQHISDCFGAVNRDRRVELIVKRVMEMYGNQLLLLTPDSQVDLMRYLKSVLLLYIKRGSVEAAILDSKENLLSILLHWLAFINHASLFDEKLHGPLSDLLLTLKSGGKIPASALLGGAGLLCVDQKGGVFRFCRAGQNPDLMGYRIAVASEVTLLNRYIKNEQASGSTYVTCETNEVVAYTLHYQDDLAEFSGEFEVMQPRWKTRAQKHKAQRYANTERSENNAKAIVEIKKIQDELDNKRDKLSELPERISEVVCQYPDAHVPVVVVGEILGIVKEERVRLGAVQVRQEVEQVRLVVKVEELEGELKKEKTRAKKEEENLKKAARKREDRIVSLEEKMKLLLGSENPPPLPQRGAEPQLPAAQAGHLNVGNLPNADVQPVNNVGRPADSPLVSPRFFNQTGGADNPTVQEESGNSADENTHIEKNQDSEGSFEGRGGLAAT